MRENPVTYFLCQVQRLGDSQRLLVVAEALTEPLLQCRIERLLTGVTERCMPHVMAEPSRLDEILVQPQSTRHAARDTRRLEGVSHSRAVVIACRIDENLCFALQPAKRLRVQDPVAIALERRAQAAVILGSKAPACLVGADGQGR